MELTSPEALAEGRSTMSSQRDTWIIVCTNFHGAVGPIPTEQLAVDLAASASALGECNYQPVRLALASVPQRATRRPEGDSPLHRDRASWNRPRDAIGLASTRRGDGADYHRGSIGHAGPV